MEVPDGGPLAPGSFLCDARLQRGKQTSIFPVQPEVMDIAKCREEIGSWQLLCEVHRSLYEPCLLVSSQKLTLFKTHRSTSQETPQSSYVQEKRAAFPTTTFP